MSNKMALDALTAALDAMEHMANVLNNIDAVDEDEDAQHDAAFEAVRAAIAELEQPKKSRIVAASMDYYPESDQRFFNFWYGHMFEDLMQPPLVGIDHATARYIWNAAAIAALQAAPQGWMPIETAPKDGTTVLVFPASWSNYTASMARWNRDEHAKKPRPYWERSDCFSKVTLSREKPPTHWMPLPATPPKD